MRNDPSIPMRNGVSLGAVMVVDDEEAIRQSLALLLERLGYTVSLAADAEQALALFDEGEFRFVVTDYKMPRMNGLELAGHIRERNPQQCIIMISGSTPNYTLSGTLPNIDAFVAKPYTLQDLEAAIAHCASATV